MFSSKDLFFAPTATTGYRIEKSLRFRSSASAYLSRTPGSAGNRQKWTWNGWVKRGILGSIGIITSCYSASTDAGNMDIGFYADDTLRIVGWTTTWRTTTQVFRDPSAWYCITIVVDTTQATANNRLRLYINGVEVTAFSTTNNPTQNTDIGYNQAATTRIGCSSNAVSSLFDGYLADVNFIDGQALTPSSFGETDATTGVWKPKAYTGTYGTNGFYLKFTDVGSTTAGGANTGYGKDFAGTNNWTTNNFGTTSTGSSAPSYDSMWDTPTPYDDGGNGVGNYCTLNPLSTTAGTYSSANLRYVGAAAWRRSNATISISSGKWYFEVTVGNAPYTPRASNTAYNAFGFGLATVFNNTTAASSITNAVIYADNGYYKNFSNAWTDSTYSVANGDVLAVAVDLDANTFTFYQNNTSRVTGTIGTTAGTLLVPIIQSYDGSYGVMDANFGQRPFTYTPPSGFKALNVQNLPTPTIAAGNKHMDILTWTGTSTSSARTFTGLGFQPDFVWGKARSVAYGNQLYDAVRGTGKLLVSNTTDAEQTNFTYGYISAFTSDGFTTTPGATDNENWNQTSATYVAWNWKANGAGTVNNVGTIQSNVSANATAGFSVVTWTFSASNSTVGHGLGVAPSMIIAKDRASGAANWCVWHSALSASSGQYLNLNTTSATGTVSTIWGGVNPTSTTFGQGAGIGTGGNSCVAYCFAAVAGYSAFGSYTGNGSADGPFVFTGFRPRYVLLKISSTTGNWVVYDTSRATYNAAGLYLYPDTSATEGGSGTPRLDFLSNGFKLRQAGQDNTSPATYIYAAFAENPLKYSLAR